jgi:hypothetical protein
MQQVVGSQCPPPQNDKKGGPRANRRSGPGKPGGGHWQGMAKYCRLLCKAAFPSGRPRWHGLATGRQSLGNRGAVAHDFFASAVRALGNARCTWPKQGSPVGRRDSGYPGADPVPIPAVLRSLLAGAYNINPGTSSERVRVYLELVPVVASAPSVAGRGFAKHRAAIGKFAKGQPSLRQICQEPPVPSARFANQRQPVGFGKFAKGNPSLLANLARATRAFGKPCQGHGLPLARFAKHRQCLRHGLPRVRAVLGKVCLAGATRALYKPCQGHWPP